MASHHIELMTRFFDRLSAEQRANLRYHAAEKTPIFAGVDAAYQFISDGKA